MTTTVDRNGTSAAAETAALASAADDGPVGAAEDELARQLAQQARAEGAGPGLGGAGCWAG